MSDVKVEVHKNPPAPIPVPTPSQQLLAKAQQSVVVDDARGRKITLKKPGVLAQFRLVEALGKTAENVVYTNMVLPIIYVADIDGEPVTAPTTKREIEAILLRLDEDGLAAVEKGAVANWGKSDPEADKDAIKK